MPIMMAAAGTREEGKLRLSVPLTGVSFSTPTQNYTYTGPDYNVRAVIDSGGEANDLPPDLAVAIFTSLGINPKTTLLPCAFAASAAQFTFTFNGAISVNVPFGNFFRPAVNDDNTPMVQDGQPFCTLLISGGGADLPVLGIPFFRSAYMVYDLDNSQIGIAQSKPDATDSNVQAIDGAIPADTIMSTLSAGTTSNTVLNTVTPTGTFSAQITGTTVVGFAPTNVAGSGTSAASASATGTAATSTSTSSLPTPKGNAAAKDIVMSKWLVAGLGAAALLFM